MAYAAVLVHYGGNDEFTGVMRLNWEGLTMKRIAVMFLSVLALTFAGCSSNGMERLGETPPELLGAANSDMDPTVVWSEDGKSWLFLTFGSTSCPTEPREIRETGERTFEVTLESTRGPFCTADIGPAMYRIPAPVLPAKPVTVDLGFGVVVTM